MFKVPEEYRVEKYSKKEDGNNGLFIVPFESYVFQVIASDGEGWEHVSVTHANAFRSPSWKEMCFIKDLFWGEEDTVVQYHPPKSEYVNNHPHVLHLWRPVVGDIISPPSILVGIKK